MRRSPPTIHLLATTATDAAVPATALMPSRGPHRGRGRGFSGRSYSDGRGHVVTGDEHFQSVRDVNSGLRRGHRGSFANQTQYRQNLPYNPRPPPPTSHPQFGHPPPTSHPQFRHSLPTPHPQFHHPSLQHQPFPPPDHRQAFRPPNHPRPRPPDYRDWEFAPSLPPPDHCERFKVLSYNILADYLAMDHRDKLYFHIPDYMLEWRWRQGKIIFELGLWSADIMCLQEVDRFHELAEELKLKGYTGIWKMRTGDPRDGCAIFWRTSRFNLLYEESIEFNKLGLRDNVAQICVLELINQHGSLPRSSTGSRKVVICNIHVLYNPKRGDIKLGQVRVLLDKAKAVSELWNDAPVVICGDFNCTPESPLYNFISEQKLDLSGIDRDKLSGQTSAVIRSPRQCRPKSSERSAYGSVQATSTEGEKEVNIEQNNSPLDMLNPDPKDNSLKKQSMPTNLEMSVKSLANVQCGKESDACAGLTQESAVDNSMIFHEVDGVKAETDNSLSEDRLAANHLIGDTHDITPTSTTLEAVQTDTTKVGSKEHMSDAISTSNQESLSENSNLDIPKGDKHLEFDCSPTSLLENDQSPRVKIDLDSTDLLNEDISSFKTSDQASTYDGFEVPHPGDGESPSDEVITNDQMNSSTTSYLVDKSHQMTNFDQALNEEKAKLFFDEIDKAVTDNKNIGEDGNNFMSALNNTVEGVTLHLGSSIESDLEKSSEFEKSDSASNNLLLPVESEGEDYLSPTPTSKYIDAEKTPYNPSLWTPMEIETATGNAERTFLEHSLPLRSTYTEATDSSGNRDSHGEPLATSYNRCFLGTVDYIWRSKGLQTTKVLAPMPKHAMVWTAGFPTKKWGSDHIALVSELAFVKDGTDTGTDVQ